jgi:hypothetical protein
VKSPGIDTNVAFVTTQICDSLCLTLYCNGPKLENCLTCYADCLTCSGPSSTQCLSCVDSANKIIVNQDGKSVCLEIAPAFENDLGTNGTYTLKYGLDISSEWIYFIIENPTTSLTFSLT